VRVLVLTKPFGALPPEELAGQLAETGADGADLLVREGQTVTPQTSSRIGDTAVALRRTGLEVGLVSTDVTAADRTADRVLGHCAGAGVPLVRVGFYRYDPVLGYAAGVDRARRDLADLAELAGRHGIRLVLALHHGTLHASAAHARRLLDGIENVLVHPDPGNQAKEGSEDIRLTFDALGGPSQVGCVGVKNAAGVPGAAPGSWNCVWQPLADGGVVPWPAVLPALAALSYKGPLSLHVHYPTDDALASVRGDLAHLRGLLREPGPGQRER
jgi:sugar phosphate isomerase/epimerase